MQKVALHPRLYFNQKNPVLIIISVATLFYVIYFALKRNAKNKPWQTADTDTHGSATWGRLAELLAHYYFKISQRDLTKNFNQGLDQKVLEPLQRKEQKQ